MGRILLSSCLNSIIVALILAIGLVPGHLYGSTVTCNCFENLSNCRDAGSSTSSSSSPSPSTTDFVLRCESIPSDESSPLMPSDVSPTQEDLGSTNLHEKPVPLNRFTVLVLYYGNYTVALLFIQPTLIIVI